MVVLSTVSRKCLRCLPIPLCANERGGKVAHCSVQSRIIDKGVKRVPEQRLRNITVLCLVTRTIQGFTSVHSVHRNGS